MCAITNDLVALVSSDKPLPYMGVAATIYRRDKSRPKNTINRVNKRE